MRIARASGSYSYLEIGSFLGGSLTPFLLDNACAMVLSIDDRGRVQPDERGIRFDYTGITTQSMLDRLSGSGVASEKLKTFDGTIDRLPDVHASAFDLAFIDGEHTDEACFRDLLWTLPMMKPDSIIVFHDCSLIYKSLKLIMMYLDKSNIAYSFFKRANSEMAALFFGKYRNVDHAQYCGTSEKPSDFFERSEASVLRSQYANRARIRFAPGQLLKLKSPFALDVRRPGIQKMR